MEMIVGGSGKLCITQEEGGRGGGGWNEMKREKGRGERERERERGKSPSEMMWYMCREHQVQVMRH